MTVKRRKVVYLNRELDSAIARNLLISLGQWKKRQDSWNLLLFISVCLSCLSNAFIGYNLHCFSNSNMVDMDPVEVNEPHRSQTLQPHLSGIVKQNAYIIGVGVVICVVVGSVFFLIASNGTSTGTYDSVMVCLENMNTANKNSEGLTHKLMENQHDKLTALIEKVSGQIVNVSSQIRRFSSHTNTDGFKWRPGDRIE